MKKNPLETPAIIVVGEVCGLAEDFNWYEKLTLFGKKIIVTRPRERSRVLAERLRSLGAEVLELPTIEIHPNERFADESIAVDECAATEKDMQQNTVNTEIQNGINKTDMHTVRKLFQALEDNYQYVIFTSPSGVNCFFDQIKKRKNRYPKICRSKNCSFRSGNSKRTATAWHFCRSGSGGV